MMNKQIKYVIVINNRIRMALDGVEIALVIAIGAGISYMTFVLVGMEIILLAVTVLLCSIYLACRKWMKLRQRGLITLCSSKMRTMLLERSILDIFRDIVYFPYITKIFTAYIRIAATKPHPMELESIFQELPKEVTEASNRKGLLSLAPSFVEEIVLPSQSRELLPQNYGLPDWKWDNSEKYQGSAQIHDETLEKRVIHFIDGKLGWTTAIGLMALTVVGASHMKTHRFKKMLVQNATFICMLLTLIALLVKARKVMRHQKKEVLSIKNKQE